MFPATRAVRRSTSGDSLVTVRVSSSVASFIVNGTWAFWPTSSSISLVTTTAKPDNSTLAS
jgi:hypothetical protein